MEKLPAAQLTDSTLTHYAELAARYVEAGLSGAANTTRAYNKADLRRFGAWCAHHDQSALPTSVEALVGFLAGLAEAGKKVATLERHCAAIAKAHAVAGVDSPTNDKQFKIFMDGVRRIHGVAQKQAAAFSLADFKRLIRGIDRESVAGSRDWALLLLGFTGAFRRSELTGLNLEDLQFKDECLVVSLRRSKTNQLGQHEEKAIFYSPDAAVCPIRALQAWLRQVGYRTQGPVFVRLRKNDQITEQRLSDQSVNLLV